MPQSVARPIDGNAALNDADAAAMRKSQFSANDQPAPAAAPLTAATTGTGIAASAAIIGLYSVSTLSIADGSVISVRCSLRS